MPGTPLSCGSDAGFRKQRCSSVESCRMTNAGTLSALDLSSLHCFDAALLAALKQWRLERSRADKVPAFVILHDSTLEHLCLRKPASLPQLRGVPGIGETKLERYGKEILELLRGR